MPCVGLSSRRISASVLSQRARITFCWLPPERLTIRSSRLSALMLRIPRSRSYLAASRLTWIWGWLPLRVCSAMYVFSRSVISGMTEFSFRLAASMATLSFMALWMVPEDTGLPHTFRVPPVKGSAPKMACISSLLPAPFSPVKPSTSPRRTDRVTSRKPGPVSPSSSRMGSPRGRVS